MSDLGHGALCACPSCRNYRAEQYAGRHRKPEPPKDAELYGLVLFNLTQLNDLKVLARGLMPADDTPKGDDLL